MICVHPPENFIIKFIKSIIKFMTIKSVVNKSFRG